MSFDLNVQNDVGKFFSRATIVLNQSLIYAVDMSSQSWRTHNLAKSEFFYYETKNQQVFPPSYQLTTRGVSFSILLNVSCFFFHPYINAI
jgi:hypothetical protein